MAEMLFVLLSLFLDTSRIYDWEHEHQGGLFDASVSLTVDDPQELVDIIWDDWGGYIHAGRRDAWLYQEDYGSVVGKPPRVSVSDSAFKARCGNAKSGCVDAGGIVLRTADLKVLLHETAHALNNTHGRTGHGRDFRCIAVSLYASYGVWDDHYGLAILQEFCIATELYG